MSEVEKIKDLLRRAYDGDAWYGPSLRDSLQGVTSEKAMARPIPGAHSIWEIVLHVTAWLGAVRDRLERGVVTLPTEGDWPTIANQTEAGWTTALDALEKRHLELEGAMVGLGDESLPRILGNARERVTGGGVSAYVTLHGIIQHNVYHAGQISLLKKAL